MADGAFKFENCPLKHYVRKEGWLPLCKERAGLIKAGRDGKAERPRLKYFTFCAAGALDVVMLDLEKIVRRSSDDLFDSVYFFDVDAAYVAKTRESIPGANGFPGDFVEVVLTPDPDEAHVVDTVATLEPIENADFTKATVQKQQLLAMRREFVRAFPFDIVNLDLERYLFIPREKLPGKLVNAFRKVFEWQRRAGENKTKKGGTYTIDGFSLMFTLRIGPTELGEDYKAMMEQYVEHNIGAAPELGPIFNDRSGGKTPKEYLEKDFAGFFKLAAPKTVLSILKEQDWHVVGGVKIFEFERQTLDQPYRMLHFTMDVRRNNPPVEARAPGMVVKEAEAAYASCVKSLFSEDAVQVESKLETAKTEILAHLERVFQHKKKVVPG